jgi:DNA-binding response OmpR family regulator
MTRILIVEDEPRIAAFVSRGLESAGYETLIFEDGPEGLEAALRGDGDLVLLDVGLPTMDGFEVLRELRARGSAVPATAGSETAAPGQEEAPGAGGHRGL